MAARSVNSGTIVFGLVSAPFKLYPASSTKAARFHWFHKACGARLGKRWTCPYHNVVVDRSEAIRGFEHQKDMYVLFTDAQVREFDMPRCGELEILEFVPANTVPSLHIKRTYFVGPDRGANRAYQLIADALTRHALVGVGRYAKSGRDLLVLVRPCEGGLILQESLYADEVRSFDEVDCGPHFELTDLEREMADTLILQHRRDAFDATRFKDERAERILAAVNRRVAGEDDDRPVEPKAKVIEMLGALQRSVANADRIRELAPPSGVKLPPDSDVKLSKKRKPSQPGTVHVLHPERN